MKKAAFLNTQMVFILLGLLVFSLSIHAEWAKPTFLGELNDYSLNTVAFLPRMLSDGSGIYFLRPTTLTNYVLFEAKFDETTGLYSNQRIVTELATQGRGVFSFWISPDGLRMYYAEPIYLNGQWQRVIRLATRSSKEKLWTYSKNLMELHYDIVDSCVSLTADELTIIWTSKPLNSAGKYYQATRDSIDKPFGSVRILTEFSILTENQIYLSADGLTVYFDKRTESLTSELWKGTRQTLDDSFTGLEPVSAINQYGQWTSQPCLSVDQRTMWFLQRPGDTVDLNNTGIYYSRWVETPYEKAVRCLTEARDIKTEILDKMDIADQKEKEALSALADMLKTGLPEGLTRRDIQKIRMDILHALCMQFIAERNIKMSLRDLEKCIDVLAPEAVDTE